MNNRPRDLRPIQPPIALSPLPLRADGLIAEIGSPSRLVSGLVRSGLVARTPAEHDRRAVTLQLTATGRRIAREVAKAENQLYAAINDATAGHDVSSTVALLRDFVADRPTGRALERRAAPSPQARGRAIGTKAH